MKAQRNGCSAESTVISVFCLTCTGSWGHSHFICSLENSFMLHWEKHTRDFSYKKASLKSRWGAFWRLLGRILQQLQYQNLPDDRYLKNQPWEPWLSPDRAMAVLTIGATMQWCKCMLLLPMFCRFKYSYWGIWSPGNDGPQQDYQEGTDSLHVTCSATCKYYRCWPRAQSYKVRLLSL